jgi:ABC-type nitrate/sulfonate/bicarbonate transport system substrate-binding protein
VLATRAWTARHRPVAVEATIERLRHATVGALRDRDATIAKLVEASGADEELVRAQLDAVAPALLPPMRLDRAALEGWARFDARFGILERPPDVDEAFRL